MTSMSSPAVIASVAVVDAVAAVAVATSMAVNVVAAIAAMIGSPPPRSLVVAAQVAAIPAMVFNRARVSLVGIIAMAVSACPAVVIGLRVRRTHAGNAARRKLLCSKRPVGRGLPVAGRCHSGGS